VHLAGVADEAPLPDLLSGGVLVAHHVLEASRRAGVRRVVLASSNRLTGCYPISQLVSPEMPPRPDGLYGVSKVPTGEGRSSSGALHLMASPVGPGPTPRRGDDGGGDCDVRSHVVSDCVEGGSTMSRT
jgi:hypothetical protein